MSKGKTTVKETVESVIEAVTQSAISTTGTIKPGKKMSVHRYLQDYPQGFYIDGLMKFKYSGQFKTKEEWDVVVEELKNQKIY